MAIAAHRLLANTAFAWSVNGSRKSEYRGLGIHRKRDILCAIDLWNLSVSFFRLEDGHFLTRRAVPQGYDKEYELEVDEALDQVVIRHFGLPQFAYFKFEWLNTPPYQDFAVKHYDSFSHDFAVRFDSPLYSAGFGPGIRCMDSRRLVVARINRALGTLYISHYREALIDGRVHPFLSDEKQVCTADHFDPYCVCYDNLGRLIVGEFNTGRLHLISPSGESLGTLVTSNGVFGIAFDFRRGRVIFSDMSFRIRAVESNAWFTDMFRSMTLAYDVGDRSERLAMQTIVEIRTLCPETPLSGLPNEVLFLIFEALVGL